MQSVFLYIGAAMPFLWGLAHLFPTQSVVAGFGEISLDNRRIITMEWLTEGVALIFMGLLIAAITFVDSATPVSKVAYALTAAGLLALAVVSVFTGYRIRFLPFRLCPFIFSGSAVLILVGGVL